jgi:hypothetical protein
VVLLEQTVRELKEASLQKQKQTKNYVSDFFLLIFQLEISEERVGSVLK